MNWGRKMKRFENEYEEKRIGGWGLICDGCRCSPVQMIILRDELWRSICRFRREILCLECMESRLGRLITGDDLKECQSSRELETGYLLFSRSRQQQGTGMADIEIEEIEKECGEQYSGVEWADVTIRRLIGEIWRLKLAKGAAMEPRAYTSDEIKDEFLGEIRSCVRFWSQNSRQMEEKTIEDRLNGLAFSILSVIDGTSSLPAFNLAVSPHPDDKGYCQEQGENWYENGTVINSNAHLHEEYYKN